VLATGCAAGRGSVHTAPDVGHRLGAREIGIREDVRVGNAADVGDVLVGELEACRLSEVEVPVHVARGEEPRLIGDEAAGGVRILRGRRLAEGVGQPAEPARTQLQHFDQVRLLDAERPRWVELRGLCDHLLLLNREPADLRLEVGLLDAGRRERLVQELANLIGSLCDRADVHDVGLVLVVLAARGTAANADDEQDGSEDQEGDQPGQTEHGDQPLRRPDRTARTAGRRPPRRADALRRLLGLRLVEEVELDV